jgi:hypothetical protein
MVSHPLHQTRAVDESNDQRLVYWKSVFWLYMVIVLAINVLLSVGTLPLIWHDPDLLARWCVMKVFHLLLWLPVSGWLVLTYRRHVR